MIKSLFCTILMVIAFAGNSFACNKVSVKDYGAVGNEKVDDTQAIQTAINSGKTIVFPTGEYLINDLGFVSA